MSPELSRPWLVDTAREIGGRAERDLRALVGVSSPSGDVAAAEEAVAVASALLPSEAQIQRLPCSSAAHAPDLLAVVSGAGRRKLLLLGHLDTVVSHSEHRPPERRGERLIGSGAVDMKGGIALAIGVFRALTIARPRFAELSLLAVNDEEWRAGDFAHAERFRGYDACLCFEAGQLGPQGEDAVVVRRKAAATLRVRARGVAAHSGSAPDQGRNALLALVGAAERISATHDPSGPRRLTAVPTVLHSGEAFNVVPSFGELVCDLRADELAAFADPLAAAAAEPPDGVRLEAEIVRRWPGMDTRGAASRALSRASELIGRPILGAERGGASDASHLAWCVPLTIDGLGPRGGRAHAPDEYVLLDSLRPRAEVALAVSAAVLEDR